MTILDDLKGVKRDRSDAFFYDDGDVDKVRVPLSLDTEGDLRLSPEKLNEWFGIKESTLPTLPAFFVSPRLYSSWADYYRDGTAAGWWNVDGEMVVYRPIEWVPTVARIKDWPKNSILTTLEEEEITTTVTKLFGSVELSLEISGGGNYMGMKAEAKAKAESSLTHEWERKTTNKYVREGKVGEKPLVEVALGLMLRVEEVYTRDLKIWLDDRKRGTSMGWSGGPGWNEIRVQDKLLRHVSGLQFHNITNIGNGTGHLSSLYVQALPVIDAEKKFTDLHIILSCAGWVDWYAYVVGEKGKSEGHKKLMVYPKYNPSTTLMSLDDL